MIDNKYYLLSKEHLWVVAYELDLTIEIEIKEHILNFTLTKLVESPNLGEYLKWQSLLKKYSCLAFTYFGGGGKDPQKDITLKHKTTLKNP